MGDYHFKSLPFSSSVNRRMSFSFYIDAPHAPDYQRVIDDLDSWDLHCSEEELEEGPWPAGTIHFYRDEVSTRGVEITHDENRFQVRILTLSSPEDYELALRFVRAAALELERPIEPEDYQAVTIEEMEARYDADWIRRTNQHGAMVIRQLVQENDTGFVTLMGAKRPIYLGPRIVQEIEEAGDEDGFLDRLMERMREVQNVDGDSYFFANVMEAHHPQSPDRKFTFAVFGPTVSYLLPDAQYIALIVDPNEAPIFIPSDKLPLILPEDSWNWLDERQMLIEVIDESLWDGIIRRARQFETRPLEGE
jgi:hypothetical protein